MLTKAVAMPFMLALLKLHFHVDLHKGTQTTREALAAIGNCMTIKEISSALNCQDCVAFRRRI